MYRTRTITLILSTLALKYSVAQTHVQTTTLFQTTTASTISKAFGAASTTGNLIVVHLDWDGQTRHINTVTDNKGNTYHKINGSTNWNGANYRAELWYAYNITGGAVLTVSATLSGAPTSFSQIYISEYSGIAKTIDPLDQNSVTTGNAAAVNSGSKTPTYANELIYGASIGASGTLTTGGGFTNRSTANSNIIEDKTVTTIGSYNTAFTSAGGNWIAQMASFITTNAILPVEFSSFTTQSSHDHILLQWTTASERNNDYFTVERSDNGSEWQAVGIVKSAGNSDMPQSYSCEVDETNAPYSDFRIRQTDLDGRSIYSKTIQVNNGNRDQATVIIYSNPTNGHSLSGKASFKTGGTFTIAIFDMGGKMVGRSVANQPMFTVNFTHCLPPGVYCARFSSSGYSASTSFLVND
ncbi:MAG: T9SS type A sorting domain-containing protein [Bacteroidota bacterium]|nr:T9SS type A sorting domain-containing protein [Bacteroidota bacterium]MDP4218050.1 T9SS type A sorting domain-containing protein [Bacteroidota bacterium]MDP4246853.1 T9SS type A sorting domain-containing protein [Bacteroidota bacterium]MDP4254184.1 T9SS type A sorting domain-containing protein [Bacteroidota bacterium]MDP4257624.1 T9SS type A sorting domain-containing protein [Bacteroidota bacterium]